jgi:hypothetical protein
MAGLDAKKVTELRAFVSAVDKRPELLADPRLAFFRTYLESLGAKLPAAAFKAPKSTPATAQPTQASRIALLRIDYCNSDI